MQDNAKTETLVRYMDGEMDAVEKEATEKLLQEDAALQQRYQYLLAAKAAIKAQGLRNRIQAIHQEHLQAQTKTSKSQLVKNASFLKAFMRIAAILIVVVLGYGVLQYVTTTNQSVYNDNFISYQLPVNRGVNAADSLAALYNAGNYNAVINAFNTKPSKDQQDYFIAGQAYLQLNNTGAAINAFKQVKNRNTKSTEKYFEQETDYYLMLAYIKAGKIDAAEDLLNKITADKQHLFYSKAKGISRIKLNMLKWKE